MPIHLLNRFRIRYLLITGFSASFFLLNGCATPPQTQQLLHNPSPAMALAYDIKNVPFYNQQAFYCGPTTLAEIFEYNDIKRLPEEIAPLLFIPKREGSLQLEMVAAIRQQGLLAYTERGNLNKLLYFVQNNIPIIVLQNLGLSWYPIWHYAVVKGYDLTTEKLILHTGDVENRHVDLSVFERTWQRANFWLLIALPGEHSLTQLEPFTYVSSAQDLITVKELSSGLTHLKNATILWPDYWLSYFLLGNYFLENAQNNENIKKAIFWFEKGYLYSAQQSLYLNNYAFALYKDNQLKKAKEIILQAEQLGPNNINIRATKNDIFK
ncbi:PA2778 family cysteine peptidase [Colwelliaceae bacterium 6471]